MTRKRWLELYDTLDRLETEGSIEDTFRFMRLILIELKPDESIKHPITIYTDEPPF